MGSRILDVLCPADDALELILGLTDYIIVSLVL